MVSWESQSKTPFQSPEDGHIYCILLIRFAFCHASENFPLRYLFYDTMDIYFCGPCRPMPPRNEFIFLPFWRVFIQYVTYQTNVLVDVLPSFVGDIFVYSTPSKRGVLVHKNSLASCPRYCHSIGSRALTCPSKQSNLSAWSLLS